MVFLHSLCTMHDEAGNIDRRRDGITISNFQLAIALSVLLHVAVLWQWQIQKPPLDDASPPPLTVKLQPIPGPPPAVVTPPQRRAIVPPVPPVPPAPPVAAPTPPPVARAPQTPPTPPRNAPPPVIAITPPAPKEAAPPPMRAPPAEDFAAYVEAQRRARGESPAVASPPAEDENARATRLAVANLATQKAQGVGYDPNRSDPNRSGGIFTMKNRGVDYAEFMFNGWHTDARRNLQQLVEVLKGNNENIELAVVRKMIEIIRANVQGDFQWRSHRMNKVVTLSARERDNAGLEEFMIREFFYNPRIGP